MLNRIILWSHLVLDFCLLEIVFLCFTFSGSNCIISFLIKLPKSSPKPPPWNRYSQLQPSRASALGGSSTRQEFRLFSSYWALRLTSSFLVRLFNRAGNIYGRPLQRGQSLGRARRSWPPQVPLSHSVLPLDWLHLEDPPQRPQPLQADPRRWLAKSGTQGSSQASHLLHWSREEEAVSPQVCFHQNGKGYTSGSALLRERKMRAGQVENEEWESLSERHERRGRRKLHSQRLLRSASGRWQISSEGPSLVHG